MQRKWLISFISFLMFSINVIAQDMQTDMHLLLDKERKDAAPLPARKVKWMDTKSNNVLVKYNPVNVAFGGLMFLYQRVLSPQLSASCIYTPSCSNFGKQLCNEYGLVKGIFLTADRVTRCNRVSASDISPLIVDEHSHLAKDDVRKFKFSHW